MGSAQSAQDDVNNSEALACAAIAVEPAPSPPPPTSHGSERPSADTAMLVVKPEPIDLTPDSDGDDEEPVVLSPGKPRSPQVKDEPAESSAALAALRQPDQSQVRVKLFANEARKTNTC